MDNNSIAKRWEKTSTDALVGKKVTNVRYFADGEAKSWLWGKRPLVIEFDDGTLMFPMCDDEGNDGGTLFVSPGKDLPSLTIPTINS